MWGATLSCGASIVESSLGWLIFSHLDVVVSSQTNCICKEIKLHINTLSNVYPIIVNCTVKYILNDLP